MTAFCTILADQPLPPNALDNMMVVLASMGQDGSGVYQSGNVALGHRLTHITPESIGEVQPAVDQERGVVISADCRLDNRPFLCKILNTPSDLPDSQLVLLAYAKWGSACVDHLLGDFAFVIWDGEKLFCARDFIGAKPFYYHPNPRRFVASSDIETASSISPTFVASSKKAKVATHTPAAHTSLPSASCHQPTR
ncbi:MAG: hypothetical protein ACPG8W_15305 [Candidatus Promineifilaceae bacterium]